MTIFRSILVVVTLPQSLIPSGAGKDLLFSEHVFLLEILSRLPAEVDQARERTVTQRWQDGSGVGLVIETPILNRAVQCRGSYVERRRVGEVGLRPSHIDKCAVVVGGSAEEISEGGDRPVARRLTGVNRVLRKHPPTFQKNPQAHYHPILGCMSTPFWVLPNVTVNFCGWRLIADAAGI